MRQILSVIILAFTVFTVPAQMTKEERYRNAKTLLEQYLATSIDPYRGMTKEEWEQKADTFLMKVNEANTREEVFFFTALFWSIK